MPRRLTSLLTALTFLVMAATGVLAFVRPFSPQVVGLHALMGFGFIALIAVHAWNNRGHLAKYSQRRQLWLPAAIVALLSAILYLQPGPIAAVLRLSPNRGPAKDSFSAGGGGMVYRYDPAPGYRMTLDIRAGESYDPASPPRIAIWLENQSSYHIKTLHASATDDRDALLPYWAYKVAAYEKAKGEAESGPPIDAVSAPTQNDSFDPADYILPSDVKDTMPYELLVEINQPGDAHGSLGDQPSLVYSVQIDNRRPATFQLLRIAGSPRAETIDGEEKWSIYYLDESLGSALKLIDSALLTIER